MYVFLRSSIMDIEKTPLVVNSDRIFAFKGRPVTYKMVDFGSELKQHDPMAIFQAQKIRKVDDILHEDLKEKMRNLLEEAQRYKMNHDKYAVVVELIESQMTDILGDTSSFISSTHAVCLDMEYRQIVINTAQKNALNQIVNLGAATRALIGYAL